MLDAITTAAGCLGGCVRYECVLPAQFEIHVSEEADEVLIFDNRAGDMLFRVGQECQHVVPAADAGLPLKRFG